MRWRFLSIAGLVMMIPGLPVGAGQITAFVNDSISQLLRVDLSTGAVEWVGATGLGFGDIAFSPEHGLFGVTTSYLYKIDPDTGAPRPVGPHGYGGAHGGYQIDALTFDENGVLYGAGNDVLITLDPFTGAGAAVGSLSGYRSAGDLVFNDQGRLFLTTSDGLLVEVDPRGSGATPIGRIPYDDVFALAASSEGDLYGLRTTNDILRFDLQTGQGSLMGRLETDAYLGYAWGATIPDQFVPEPATLTLLLIAALLLLKPRKARVF